MYQFYYRLSYLIIIEYIKKVDISVLYKTNFTVYTDCDKW